MVDPQMEHNSSDKWVNAMSTKALIRLTLLSVSVMCVAPVHAAAAGDASMHEVYLAAEAGKFGDAQAMMGKVLHDHPNSGKAHFVEAELLARQGLLSQAEAELGNAERLAPGLPFAKPAAVEKLRKHIAALHAPARTIYAPAASPAAYAYAPRDVPAPAGSGLPWSLLLGGLGLVAFIILALRFMARRTTPDFMPGRSGNYSPTPAGPSYGGAAPYGGPAPSAGPMMGPGAGGIGSGIMGGLATGAALGAGLVAGEALMHHFTDGNRNRVPDQPPAVRNDVPAPDDMGGNDFGVSDSSSWDDGGGSSGSDDWN